VFFNSLETAAKINQDCFDVLWQSEMHQPMVKKWDSIEDDEEAALENMNRNEDYLTIIAMNKKIVVVGASCGLLRVFDRTTGEKLQAVSLNNNEGIMESPYIMAMHFNTLAIITISCEGGARSNRAATLVLMNTDEETGCLSGSQHSIPLTRPAVDVQEFGLHIDGKRVVAAMEIVRVWHYGMDDAHSQLKLSAVPLSDYDTGNDTWADIPPEEEIDEEMDERICEEEAMKYWSRHKSRALWVDEERIITGDASGAIRMWSFSPKASFLIS